MPITGLQPLNEETFRAYGSALVECPKIPTARGSGFDYWSEVMELDYPDGVDVGVCTVHRQEADGVTWFERHHRTGELLIPLDPVALPVLREGCQPDLFEVRPGQAVLLAPGVWHSACLPVQGDEARYFVLFRKGTPREDVEKVEYNAG